MSNAAAISQVRLPMSAVPQAVILSFEQYQHILALYAAVDKVLQHIRPLHAISATAENDLDFPDAEAACLAITHLESAFMSGPTNDDSDIKDDEEQPDVPF